MVRAATGQVRLARANGTLSWLPFALDYLAEIQIQAGELSAATALLAEGERIDPGSRAATLPYVSLLLAAWRGDAPTAAELTEHMVQGARARGEGAALTVAEYAQAVLYNGLGDYRLAAEAASGPAQRTSWPSRHGRCTSWQRRRCAAISRTWPPRRRGGCRR